MRMRDLARGLSSGLLVAGVLSAALAVAPAAVAAPAANGTQSEGTIRCRQIQDRGDTITAYGCRNLDESSFDDTFSVQGPRRTFWCETGFQTAEDELVGQGCEQVD